MNNQLSLEKELEELLYNPVLLAKLAAPICLKVFSYDVRKYYFYGYPLAISFFGIKKSDAKNLKEAFIILFIAELHDVNEWKDYFVGDEDAKTENIKPSVEEWESAIRDIWISDFFHLEDIELDIKQMDTNVFIKKFFCYNPFKTFSEEEYKLRKDLSTTKTVYSLFKKELYNSYFGETKDYYFFADAGVYD